MKWYYKASFFLLLLSQTFFLALAAYHTDNELYYPDGNLNVTPTVGYSWIWYHLDQWIISLFLGGLSLIVVVFGLMTEWNESRNQNKSKLESSPEKS